MFYRFLALAASVLIFALPALGAAPIYEPVKGERIAIVGGGAAERMSIFGYFEAQLHTRFPTLELAVRNFARPADEVGLRQRPNDYTKLDDPLAVFGPDTFLCFFGFNEAFAGPAGLPKFKTDYGKFLDDFAQTYPHDGKAPRFVLVSPLAFETSTDPLQPNGPRENANLKLYAAAVAEVATQRGLPFVDLFAPTLALFAQQPGWQFTINGCHQNAAGDRELARLLDRALFGSPNLLKLGSPQFEKLRAAITDKGWVHHQDYRMLNGWYVYGGRRTYDKNTFPLEYAKIRAMVAVRDRYVWDLAQGRPVPPVPDDSNTGELYTPPTMFGARPYSEPKELKYLSPEECIATMKVPAGFKVSLFASEREFPELAKPDQINFDNQGRLWVSCMPTYPQWKPGDHKPNDKLLIFQDTDGDGKADKCTTFYDKLQCPTGFEFWNGGVLVVDEPHILFLQDTDGDDRADVVEQWTDGWATDDSHHCVNAWEWSNGGLLHLLEGVSLSTAVETPWGPVRNRNSPGCYVVDPRTQKIRHFDTPGYGNPWCYVFDKWGQGFVGDGTSAQQHWDSPLSGAPAPNRRGIDTWVNNEGMRPAVGNEFLYTRQFPDDVQGQFIYACVINMNGLTRFDIRDDGAGFRGQRLKQTVTADEGHEKQQPNDLLTSTDKNFRPVDPMIGPDGALWFGDWCAALIGHMQYSQRDPNRDHERGRIYRLTYPGKPLLKPVTQFGKSVPEVLDQLKEYEPRTRYRARSELRARPAAQVLAALQPWLAKLDPQNPEYDRLRCEALWVQQGHHAVDPALLKMVLRAKTGEARTAATRVLADEWSLLGSPLELLQPQVADEFPRTRLEAVRALSFVPTAEAAALALSAANQPLDYWSDYTLQMTLGALETQWRPLEKAGKFAARTPAEKAFLVDYDLLSKPGGPANKIIHQLLGGGLSEEVRNQHYGALARMSGNAKNGATIFNRICVACHKIDDQGVEYGPDLSKVGGRLSKQEIIESIIDPNAKMDPKFVTLNVETTAGEAYSGFIQEETPETLSLRIAGGQTKELKIADLRKREAIKQSSMPEGLAGGMSGGEFLDLVNYLTSRK